MAEGYFPGSRLPISSPTEWESDIPTGKTFSIGGREIELLTISQLAEALNRSPQTVRKWERKGIIPRAVYQKAGKNNDPRGKRRLYSRPQVEALVRIAGEENLLHDLHRHVSSTRFTTRVFEAFKEMQ